jgi:hypothetical protein
MSVEAPFHVITNKLFHQLRPVGIQESAYGFRKDILFVSKPAFFNKR